MPTPMTITSERADPEAEHVLAPGRELNDEQRDQRQRPACPSRRSGAARISRPSARSVSSRAWSSAARSCCSASCARRCSTTCGGAFEVNVGWLSCAGGPLGRAGRVAVLLLDPRDLLAHVEQALDRQVDGHPARHRAERAVRRRRQRLGHLQRVEPPERPHDRRVLAQQVGPRRRPPPRPASAACPRDSPSSGDGPPGPSRSGRQTADSACQVARASRRPVRDHQRRRA